jgi:hypothetical protein
VTLRKLSLKKKKKKIIFDHLGDATVLVNGRGK